MAEQSVHATATAGETHAGDQTEDYGHPRRTHVDPAMQVRAADLEPYVGLRYLSKLFKLMAIVLILLLLSEIVTGLATQGITALTTLLGESSRLIVLAGLLWGSGDLAILLIDMGHDLRATRILMARQLAHADALNPASAAAGQIPHVPHSSRGGSEGTASTV